MSFIVKQPNGLYCRFSTATDCPSHWNMTEEDYIELKKQQAEEEAIAVLRSSIRPFNWVKDYFVDNNMTQKEFEQALREMHET